MTAENYSVEICNQLEDIISKSNLLRDYPPSRYDPGRILSLDATGVCPAGKARLRVKIEKFVGGGFAGQVYRVRLLDIAPDSPPLAGLQPGGIYAVKIMIPASGFARVFRNAIYRLGYQTFFALQVNQAVLDISK